MQTEQTTLEYKANEIYDSFINNPSEYPNATLENTFTALALKNRPITRVNHTLFSDLYPTKRFSKTEMNRLLRNGYGDTVEFLQEKLRAMDKFYNLPSVTALIPLVTEKHNKRWVEIKQMLETAYQAVLVSGKKYSTVVSDCKFLLGLLSIANSRIILVKGE